jgi:hypothetical protein
MTFKFSGLKALKGQLLIDDRARAHTYARTRRAPIYSAPFSAFSVG